VFKPPILIPAWSFATVMGDLAKSGCYEVFYTAKEILYFTDNTEVTER
jgi:hypothetical protein